MVPWVDLEKCSSTSFEEKCRRSRKRLRRHIPHADRPSEFVRKRNQRERRRVEKVNNAFEDLRNHVPFMKDDDKTSKASILNYASNYIRFLSTLLLENQSLENNKCSRKYVASKQTDSLQTNNLDGCCWNSDEQMGSDCLYEVGIASTCRFEQCRQWKVVKQNVEFNWAHFPDEATSHIMIPGQTSF